MLLLVGVLGFFTLIIIMAKLGRASASSDPNLDPLLNPNIRVGKNWWQVAIWSFFCVCVTLHAPTCSEWKRPCSTTSAQKRELFTQLSKGGSYFLIRRLECQRFHQMEKNRFFCRSLRSKQSKNKLWWRPSAERPLFMFLLLCFGGQYNGFHDLLK